MGATAAAGAQQCAVAAAAGLRPLSARRSGLQARLGAATPSWAGWWGMGARAGARALVRASERLRGVPGGARQLRRGLALLRRR